MKHQLTDCQHMSRIEYRKIHLHQKWRQYAT